MIVKYRDSTYREIVNAVARYKANYLKEGEVVKESPEDQCYIFATLLQRMLSDTGQLNLGDITSEAIRIQQDRHENPDHYNLV